MVAITSDTASAACDAVVDLVDGGELRIEDEARAVLAVLDFGEPAFDDAEDGTARALPIASEESASASGEAARYRIVRRDGRTVMEGPIEDIGLNTATIVAGARITVTRLEVTAHKETR